MEKKLRMYVLIVSGISLQPEHASIRLAVERNSEDDFVELFSRVGHTKADGIPFAFGFLFTSTRLPHEMGFGTLAGDQLLLSELSEETRPWLENSGRAAAWFQKRHGLMRR